MFNLLLKALVRTFVIFFIGVFLMFVVWITTGNDALTSLACPIGVYLGILSYAVDDEERNIQKEGK